MAPKGDEFLGTCEVSISGVLSNCGQLQEEWAVLVKDGAPAGHVLLSMQFKRQVDIDLEKIAQVERRARNAKLREEKKLKDALKKEIGKMQASGQATPAGSTNEMAAVKKSMQSLLTANEGLKSEITKAKSEVAKQQVGFGRGAKQRSTARISLLTPSTPPLSLVTGARRDGGPREEESSV